MDLGLKDKTAIIAGSSKGLGFATARTLLTEGARVIINGRSQNSLELAHKQLVKISDSIKTNAADVMVEDDCKALVDHCVSEYNGLDILITNSGGPPAGSFEDFSLEDWRKAIDLSFLSHLQLIRAAIPHLRKSKLPSVLAITSFTVKNPLDNLILSNTIRAATGALIKSLSLELGAYKIRFNSILPGWTRTDRVENLLKVRAEKSGSTIEKEAEKISNAIPLGRMADPDEFARAAAFIVSPAASYINGIMLTVDGGITRGLL